MRRRMVARHVSDPPSVEEEPLLKGPSLFRAGSVNGWDCAHGLQDMPWAGLLPCMILFINLVTGRHVITTRVLWLHMSLAEIKNQDMSLKWIQTQLRSLGWRESQKEQGGKAERFRRKTFQVLSTSSSQASHNQFLTWTWEAALENSIS